MEPSTSAVVIPLGGPAEETVVRQVRHELKNPLKMAGLQTQVKTCKMSLFFWLSILKPVPTRNQRYGQMDKEFKFEPVPNFSPAAPDKAASFAASVLKAEVELVNTTRENHDCTHASHITYTIYTVCIIYVCDM